MVISHPRCIFSEIYMVWNITYIFHRERDKIRFVIEGLKNMPIKDTRKYSTCYTICVGISLGLHPG